MSQTTERADPWILAIETATRAGSVAVARGEHILSTRVGDASVSHSSNLIEMIESALIEANAKLSDINLFAAAIGPGSFTGLRIGLATIKAFAACTGRKVAGVSTLATIAHAAGVSGDVVALLPAGRGEVFAQMFSVEAGEVTPTDHASHLKPRALLEKYGSMQRLSWAGEGAHVHVEALKSWATSNSIPLEPNVAGWTLAQQVDRLATSVALLALSIHREGKSVTAEELHAEYVRASDAEINERWQQQNAQHSAQN